MSTPANTTIRIALDWTPNTIHSGLFLAQSTGIYTSHNLTVHLLPPDPAYSTAPVRRLAAGEVDLAVCPSESCIAYAESGSGNLRPQAIYAVLAKDASAIAAGPGGGVSRMRDLGGQVGEGGKVEGKTVAYGSYNARYEDAIVTAMVVADGGDGKRLVVERATGKFGLFDAVKEGRLGATWIFEPWEGVEAELEGVEVKRFRVGEFGIPYGYSPVIVRNAAGEGGLGEDVLARFVKATQEGYELAMEEPEKAVDVLEKMCEPARSKEFLRKSQQSINQYFTDGLRVGRMDPAKWSAWLKWLRERELLVGPREVQESQLFTNEFFR